MESKEATESNGNTNGADGVRDRTTNFPCWSYWKRTGLAALTIFINGSNVTNWFWQLGYCGNVTLNTPF